MQAHLEKKPQSAKTSSAVQPGTLASPFSPPNALSPESPRVGSGGALYSVPAPQHQPLTLPPFPLVGGMQAFGCLCPAELVSSLLNTNVPLLFYHPPPCQILIGYHGTKTYLPLSFHFVSQNCHKSLGISNKITLVIYLLRKRKTVSYKSTVDKIFCLIKKKTLKKTLVPLFLKIPENL